MTEKEQINSIVKTIFNSHLQSGLYNETRETVLYRLFNAYDSYFVHRPDGREINYDFLRMALRACIKFSYEDCKSGNLNERLSYDTIYSYQKEIEKTINFNLIRNIIDRARLNQFSSSIENGLLVYTHNETDRSINYDIYQRQILDTIPGSKHTKDNISVADWATKLAFLIKSKQEFKSKQIFKPVDSELKPFVEYWFKKYLEDYNLEICNFKISNYLIGEYILVYSYIAAIAMQKSAYLIKLGDSNELKLHPAFKYPRELLKKHICEFFSFDQDIVESILNDMTYDYEFHKNRLTIYQPLHVVGDYYIGSCNSIFTSYIIEKLIKLHDQREGNVAEKLKLHNFLSNRMNDELGYYLDNFDNLKYYKNCKLALNSLTKAEIDMVLVDETNKEVFLMEQKRYMPVDNDFDQMRVDEKINVAIKSRLEKDERVLKNIHLFFEQNNIPFDYEQYRISSIIVTLNNAGSCYVKDDINVIDEGFFKFAVFCSKGDLKKAREIIQSKEVYDIIDKTIFKDSYSQIVEYNGIKVKTIYKNNLDNKT
ncbi:MAG: hypothetical protein MJ222_04820 [Bacilli bacterium]|nr:hypothetical protein [Bacilli bacterium]